MTIFSSDRGIAHWAIAALLIAATPTNAHEFWLDAEIGSTARARDISVEMLVGQDFLGQSLPYLSETVRQMTHWSPSEAIPIDARLGDKPAIQGVPVKQPGLHRFTMQTNPAYIVFDDMAEFTEYLEYEGLGDIALRHGQRGLGETDIAEAYIRNARTLVQVGKPEERQIDQPTGMPFEIVALANPFVQGLGSLDVALTWMGAPVAQTQIAVFHLPIGGQAPTDTSRRLLRTDPQGRANIDRLTPGKYLLNAVRMEPVDGPGSVVWESHWASLTFEVPAP